MFSLARGLHVPLVILSSIVTIYVCCSSLLILFTVSYLISLTISKIVALFVNLVFLGSAFTIMLVYVWSRRNPYVRMNFFGLMNFQAPYLPWVLLGFSLLLGNSIIVDIMGKYSYLDCDIMYS